MLGQGLSMTPTTIIYIMIAPFLLLIALQTLDALVLLYRTYIKKERLLPAEQDVIREMLMLWLFVGVMKFLELTGSL